MVKLAGVLCLLVGSIGFASALCLERKKRYLQLSEMKYMFLLIRENVRYSGLPIYLVLQKTSEKMKEPFSKVLSDISADISQNDGSQFDEVWKRKMKLMSDELSINQEQKELLFEFPRSLGLWEKEGQANAFTFYIDEISKELEQMEKEEKDKNKVIMSLGAAAGILLSVLLL